MVIKRCPHCNSTQRYRREKKGWLKLLFFVKLYKCSYCSAYYIFVNYINKIYMIEKGVSGAKKQNN